MWPFTHAAVGYLAYSAYTRLRFGRGATPREVFLVLLGSQLPDLIDKPLVLVGGPFASGRTIGHSFLFIFAVLGVLAAVGVVRGHEDRYWVPLGIAWLLQPLADGAQLFLLGSFRVDLLEVSFWLWPFGFPADAIVQMLMQVPLVSTAVAGKAAWTAQHLPSSPELKLYIRGFELLLVAVAGLHWVHHGSPGLRQLWQRVFGESST